jgi:hypothetical protein
MNAIGVAPKPVVVWAVSRSTTPMAAPAPAQHPTGFPLLGPERYVTRRELAALMGVSIDTVDRLVAEGMPSVTWGRRTRRFRPSVAIAWAARRQRTP